LRNGRSSEFAQAADFLEAFVNAAALAYDN